VHQESIECNKRFVGPPFIDGGFAHSRQQRDGFSGYLAQTLLLQQLAGRR
jgi:hypothetical protein